MSGRTARSSPANRGGRSVGERGDRAAAQRHTRAERVAQIERLERRGLATREIADRLGLARSTVNIYRADPDGQRQHERRQRYRGTCAGCGRLTSGSGGPGRAPERCRACAGEQRRSWSEQDILEAIRDWAELTGSPPVLADWSPAHAPAGSKASDRYRSQPGRWPSASTVVKRFGSMRTAVEAAGLRPTHGGGNGPPTRWDLPAITEAMRKHARRTGRAPRRIDWQSASTDHPAASTVYRAAGSWQRAVAAAGL
jgi:hypothetical protein